MVPVSFSRWRLDMRRSTLWVCALLATATLGCKQVNEQVAKVREKIAAARERFTNRGRPAQPAPAQPQPPAPVPAEPNPLSPGARPAPEIGRASCRERV